ncbi:MAG: SufD family Fe-S cluster assembly protein [Bacteroidales bacterium]|nr:SufD family Fe-S cluster assembly protein [Bacteroidales bacterium]
MSAENHKLFILRQGDKFEPLNLVLGKNYREEITFLVLPGVTADIDLNAELSGAGAEVKIRGLYLCGSDEIVSIRTNIRHSVPSTSSSQLICGIAGGQSRASFTGRIVVVQDAQKTEAFQTNRNILLSDSARIETHPELEIYADDVQCSHGATIGRLSEEEQFYMRSRGIPEGEAKILQMISFLAPVLEGLEDKEALMQQIEKSLRQMV